MRVGALTQTSQVLTCEAEWQQCLTSAFTPKNSAYLYISNLATGTRVRSEARQHTHLLERIVTRASVHGPKTTHTDTCNAPTLQVPLPFSIRMWRFYQPALGPRATPRR